jgi:hypothetical protein
LRCFFILIHILVVAILAVKPVDITASHLKSLGISWEMLSQAGDGDGVAHLAFIIIIFDIPAAPWDA